jgi:hypothetical protein
MARDTKALAERNPKATRVTRRSEVLTLLPGIGQTDGQGGLDAAPTLGGRE